MVFVPSWKNASSFRIRPFLRTLFAAKCGEDCYFTLPQLCLSLLHRLRYQLPPASLCHPKMVDILWYPKLQAQFCNFVEYEVDALHVREIFQIGGSERPFKSSTRNWIISLGSCWECLMSMVASSVSHVLRGSAESVWPLCYTIEVVFCDTRVAFCSIWNWLSCDCYICKVFYQWRVVVEFCFSNLCHILHTDICLL